MGVVSPGVFLLRLYVFFFLCAFFCVFVVVVLLVGLSLVVSSSVCLYFFFFSVVVSGLGVLRFIGSLGVEVIPMLMTDLCLWSGFLDLWFDRGLRFRLFLFVSGVYPLCCRRFVLLV